MKLIFIALLLFATNIVNAAIPTISLNASDTALVYGGGSVTFTWTSTNASTILVNNEIGSVALNGSANINVNVTTTYIFSVTSSTGDVVTAAKTITVADSPELVAKIYVDQFYHLLLS